MKNLLIIDDDEDIRLILGIVLKATGKYSIHESADGQSGGDILRKDPIDLVILDYLLPDGTGLEFFKEWKQESLFESVRILMLTARQDAQLTDELLTAGIDRVMHKPFDPAKVVAALEILSGS